MRAALLCAPLLLLAAFAAAAQDGHPHFNSRAQYKAYVLFVLKFFRECKVMLNHYGLLDLAIL
jgi:hypothetical protein